MTNKERIDQLKDLIDDRKSFLTGDPQFDEIYLRDIEALEWSVSELGQGDCGKDFETAPEQDLGKSI